MTTFLRKLWTFMGPYRARFILGLVCGILYGLANGAVVLVIKPIVDLIFNSSVNVPQLLSKVRDVTLLRPFVDRFETWMPSLKAPSSKLGLALIIGLIPAVMLLRVVLSYLSIYLVK